MDAQPCVLCEFDVDHRHINGAPPCLPCRACFVRLCDYCDPVTYFCTCSCGLEGEP